MRSRLLLTGLLLPVLVACGGGGKDGGSANGDGPAIVQQPIDIVRAAGEKTIEAGTARIAMSVEGAGITMTGTGVTATNEIKGTMKMVMEGSGLKMTMDARMLGEVIYMKMEGLPVDVTGGKWMKFDLADLGKKNNVDFEALAQLQQNDPKQSLAYIKGVSGDVKEIGKEDVRGAATTKYSATIDLKAAAAAQSDARAKDAVESMTKQLGTSTMPVTIWIDSEGRMRKMVQEIDLSKMPDAQGATGTMTTTMEMYDFGVALDVKAPPENEVTDGAALLGNMGG